MYAFMQIYVFLDFLVFYVLSLSVSLYLYLSLSFSLFYLDFDVALCAARFFFLFFNLKTS